MVNFNRNARERIKRTVRRSERQVRNNQSRRARYGRTVKFRIYTCTLSEDLNSGSSASASLLVGPTKEGGGGTITVYDTPAFITAGYKIESGTKLRVFRDHDMGNIYCLLTPAACEVEQ